MNIYAHMTKNVKKEASTKFSNLMKSLSENLIDIKHEQKHGQINNHGLQTLLYQHL